jgi:uncharacterized protein YndB with AHSA1/START domain
MTMLAAVTQEKQGYQARFERHLPHPVDEVWAWLTENEKLAQWFPELRVDELREGGVIQFDMGNGTFEEMEITSLALHSVLEYTWGEDCVRFELYAESDGCRLLLIETINRLTEHTPRDVAGWHVCLDVVEALMDGRAVCSRKDAWNEWYGKYKELIAGISRTS